MADPFRTSKDVLGTKTVVRKGSKYDKDSDAYAKQYPIKGYPDAERGNADDMMGIDLKSSASVMKDRGTPGKTSDFYDSDSGSKRFDYTNKDYKKTGQ